MSNSKPMRGAAAAIRDRGGRAQRARLQPNRPTEARVAAPAGRPRGARVGAAGQAPRARLQPVRAWASLPWPEIAALPSSGMDAALLPVGATEQHGPHLGCGMDSMLADAVCAAVSAGTGVPVLPLLPYGCSLGHSHRWPGTLSLSPQTLIALITDIGDWLHAAGFRRLFLVNAHVTNAAPLRCALEVLRGRHDGLMVAVVNTATVSPRVTRAFTTDGADWHANAAETSLTLALAPELVRRRLLRHADDPDRTRGLVFAHPVNRTSTNGVTGAPSRASAAAGRKLFRWLVADVTTLVRRGLRERAPLDHAYFDSLVTARAP